MTKKMLSWLAGVIVLAAVLAWPAAAQSPIPTPTPAPSTATVMPPTSTSVPPTATTIPPTASATPLPPTATLIPPTVTSGPTSTPLPATATTTVVPPTPTLVGPTPTSQPPTPTTMPPTASATPAQPTPAPGTATRTPVPPPLPILGYHTVRYGESLFCIGRAYVVSPWAIATQNRIGYPYWLRIGQRLAIPNAPWRYMSAGPVCARQFGGPTPPPPPPGCRVTYIVRPGDTLYAIAGRYQSTVWAIVTANHLYNPNLIFPGQVLCIP